MNFHIQRHLRTNLNTTYNNHWQLLSECGCNAIGTKADTFCDKETGQCVCKDGYIGLNCDQCDAKYYKNEDGLCKGNIFVFNYIGQLHYI